MAETSAIPEARMRTRLYGLSIELTPDVDGLPCLATADSPDLRIQLSQEAPSFLDPEPLASPPWYVGPYMDSQGRPELIIHRFPDGAYQMRYTDGITFHIADTLDEIHGWWQSPREIGDAVGYLLGPVLGLVLRLRGRICLHASGVIINHRAILFVGSEGAGKSTTAAALIARGHTFLTDDIAPLEQTNDGFVVHPGVPRIFLEPKSVQGLDVSPESALKLSATWDKTYVECLPNSQNWPSIPFPLHMVCVLNRGSAYRQVATKKLAGYEAMSTLLPHSYATRTLGVGQRAEELQFFSELLTAVPLCELRIPDDFSRMQELCDAIEVWEN